MDWGRFEHEHERLTWSPAQEDLLSSHAAIELLERTRSLGIRYTLEANLQFARLQTALIENCAHEHDGLALAMRSAFLVAASRVAKQMFYAVRTQHELTRLLLCVSDTDRLQIIESGAMLFGAVPESWPVTIAGPLATARSVTALLRRGWGVYLPTVDEDIHDTIDLFAVRNEDGLCLQVKSRRVIGTFSGIKAELLTQEPHNSNGADPKQVRIRRSLWLGTQRFNRRWRTNWQSVLHIVGQCFDPCVLEVPTSGL